MPDQSYRTFLGNLEQQGEMIRFTKEVDPLANMAAVEWKTYNQLGKSSLFTNIKGHETWQACSQILADRKKWSIGLGIDEEVLSLAVRGALGPERIAPEWWLDDPEWRSGVRDYWVVTTDRGDRLWLFYGHGATLSSGWFCQGSFA